jgi:serine/threonine protein phosphatase PrpC
MRVTTALANRLGNRSSNQDRCLVLEKPDRILLCVADGMGGHARGDLAAQTAVDSLSQSFEREKKIIANPREFLKRALHKAHLDVVDAGDSNSPPVTPRTTCVVCLVQGNHAYWAHVGDSRLYLLRGGKLVTRTRDHTPVEELLQSGALAEADVHNHPLRNSVSRCLGGAARLPEICFNKAELEQNDMLLLCSDGLWSALPEEKLVSFETSGKLAKSIERLTDEAERASYPRSDNISLVGLRWLSGETGPDTSKDCQQSAQQKSSDTSDKKDPIQQAIDDIHRAMLEYASEMKK